MTVSGINPKYAIANEQQAQQFPAIQVTDYQPRSLDEIVNFCISEDSYQLIENCSPLFDSEIIKCIYNRESILMHKIITSVRWVFLNMPPLFGKDKDTGEYSYLRKREKLKETNRITAAKCFLACLVEGELIKTSDGKPQIFTLNLTSNKTQLISSKKPQPETKTLADLNAGLQKHYKVKGNLLHLASVGLTVKPKEFHSYDTKVSALGAMFYLGNAKALTEEQQQEVFELISDEEIKELFNDPFALKGSKVSEPETVAVENKAQAFATVSRPAPKPVVKTSTQSPSPKSVVKASIESPTPKPDPAQNEKPWKQWKSENDALAWGLEQLPGMSMHRLRQEWELLKPTKFVNSKGEERESKVLPWFNRIEELKVCDSLKLRNSVN